MAEKLKKEAGRRIAVRYRGRVEQIGIYLGKFLRMFIYQSDWKVLPMAAFIAGLVGMVTSGSLFLTMEGTLMGVFALTMVCIWNGCFNSIQVICRERDVIKREHRSGMHVSAYVVSHMIYQALLCLLQTVIMVAVTKTVGLRYDLCKPLFTRWAILDFGITMFLITFAADMMSLWISSLCRTTTAAMTVMPFVLIFQLVFSGGMLALPEWSQPMTSLTISAPGLNAMAAQSDYNHQPLVAIWNRVQSMGNTEISATVTVGQVLDFLKQETPTSAEISQQKLGGTISMGQVLDFLNSDTEPLSQELRALRLDSTMTLEQALSLLTGQDLSAPEAITNPAVRDLLQEKISVDLTLGDLLDTAKQLGLLEQYRDRKVQITSTIGQLAALLSDDPSAAELREKSFTFKTTIAELQQNVGVEAVRNLLQVKAAEGNFKPAYEHSRANVGGYWLDLLLFVLVFSLLTMVTLKFIDKDKR